MNIPNLPLPNERMMPDGELVIASVWGNDDPETGEVWALLLTLVAEPPFYRVRQMTTHEGHWMVDEPATQEFPNIVPAVEAYVQAGGDY